MGRYKSPTYKDDWYAKNRELCAWKNRKRLYGISKAEFDEMLTRQDGCGICHRKDPGTGKGWSIDHDHISKRVRGVLCSRCNMGLEQFRDSITALGSAIEYLRRNSCNLGY